MPTWEDNIGDAPDLIGLNSDTVSNVGATEETNENSFIGWPTVWTKIDLSSYPAINTSITITATGAGGFEPYLEVLKVIDGTFDPNAPDFNKLDYMSGTFVGNGTTTDTSTFDLVGGTTGSSGSGTDYRSETGVFYVFFTDWNYAGSGSATVETEVPDAPVCIDAIDVFNSASPTASIVSGRVQDTFRGYDDWSFTPETQPEAALKWTWSGPAGLYKVVAGMFLSGSGSPFGAARIIISVNGNPIIPSAGSTPPSFGSTFVFNAYPGLTGGTYDTTDYLKAPWIPLKGGDVVEVFYVNSVYQNPGFAQAHIQLEYLCFYPDPLAPASTYCTPGFAFPSDPLGDAWGSPMEWGGQILIPDEIFVEAGITPYDESNFAWGMAEADYDFVALEDGTLYAIVQESITRSGGSFPFARKHYIAIKKWDGSSWSQIDTININDPDDGFPAEGVSAETDGDFVYFAWWELFSNTPGTPAKRRWKWHLKRLDVSDDSITELGSGQSARGVTSNNQNYPESTMAPNICCDEGELYVAAIEYFDNISLADKRLHVWHWTGGAWSDTGLPDPSLTDSGAFDVVGDNQFWDVLSAMCTPPGGDLTIVYSYQRFEAGVGNFVNRLVTIEYNGSWGGEILTKATDVEGSRVNATALEYVWLDLSLLWSAKLGRLVLAVDFLQGASGNAWDVLQMNDAGTQWEPVNALAPGSVTGDWRQTRNSAAIGPDGEVYRAGMCSFSSGVDFYPKILKTSEGYLAGFAVASGPQAGEASGDPQWEVMMNNTANYRIRIVGTTAYVMGNFLTLEYDYDTDTDTGSEGNGIFVFQLSYVPCRTFRPQVYRRILG